MSDATSSDEAIWIDAVDAARFAPSSHNTQPWLFRLTAEGLEVVADATRALPAVDPQFRELVISGGAAVHHLLVALRAAGHAVAVHSLPDGTDAPVLARLRLEGEVKPRPEDARMRDAIRERHTDRGPYAAETLPAAPLDELRTLAADQGARLTVVRDEDTRRRLAELVEQADRYQSRWAVVREALAWTRVPGRHADDGLPLSMTAAGPTRPQRERALAEAGPVLAVLSTLGDEPDDWVAAGRALSAVALAATARGLSTSFFDAPVEEPELRSQVGEAAGVDGMPQLLLRFGHGEGGPASPRRTLEQVLIRR